jgi:large subunit ribosomal protein L19
VQALMNKIEKKYISKEERDYETGDTVTVSMRIQEGEKTRIQAFQGVVIQKRGAGLGETFTVRKPSGNIYVEKIFPKHSPLISEVKVLRKGKTRRAKLFYLRDLTGKAARLKEIQK